MSSQLERFHDAAERALDKLKREHLVPDVELTLIWRDPAKPECYCVVTRDDPGAVAEVLLRAAGDSCAASKGIIRAMRAAVAKAIADEREACAELAWRWLHDRDLDGEPDLADMIRARAKDGSSQ